jgi:hypothetical protein
MQEAERLRELAAWYREFAERAENPAIWESRLLMAEDLEQEAARLDHRISVLFGVAGELTSPVGKLGDNVVDNSAEARFKVA